MSEIRMEVVSELEAVEICNCNGYRFVKTYIGRGNNEGKLMMLAYDNEYIQSEIELPGTVVEREDTVIFADTSTGKMYVADKKKCRSGVTFNIGQAKKFKKSAASTKAVMMTRKGTYNWRIFRIK